MNEYLEHQTSGTGALQSREVGKRRGIATKCCLKSRQAPFRKGRRIQKERQENERTFGTPKIRNGRPWGVGKSENGEAL